MVNVHGVYLEIEDAGPSPWTARRPRRHSLDGDGHMAVIKVNSGVLTSPGGEHVVALLSVMPEAVLVTGDVRLREAVAPRYAVASPAEFAAALT